MDASISAFDPAWEEMHRRRPWGRYPSEAVVRTVLGRWPQRDGRAGRRALDVGCGGGAVAWFLAREGFTTTGLDASGSALLRARQRLDEERVDGVDLVQHDLSTDLPWPAQRFDVIVDQCTLTHLPLPRAVRAAAELSRVLAPGGIFVSVCFADSCTDARGGEAADGTGFRRGFADGPFAGLGGVQFLARAQLDELFAPFAVRTVDTLVQSRGGGATRIDQWLVACRHGA